jgi:hypothetical protein
MPLSELPSSDFETQILEESITSPAVAMMRLSLEIDRQLRLILAVIGRLQNYNVFEPLQALDIIVKNTTGNTVSTELRDTVANFWELRNAVVHGGRSRQALTLRAVDYGIRILRLVKAIPRPSFVVIESLLLFSDDRCSNPRPDVKGVFLESRDAQGKIHGRGVYPSRRDYTKGQSVSWEWDTNGPGWLETWYRDPDSGDIKYAWSESLEFIGRPLEQI